MKYCKKYKDTHYYLPIFGMNINICFTQEDFKYLCEKYQDYEYTITSWANGYTLMNSENGEVVIGIFNNSLSTVVHEITHLVLFLLELRHINPNESNGETMAYIQAWLFDEIVKRMDKHNGKH